MPLRIAAKLPRADTGYFKDKLEPQIDGEHIQLIGEVNDAAKEKFLAGAAALLFPIDWPEPFGLVMIEAMLSGVPVLGASRGAVPEVVDDGITGVVCDDATEMVAAARIADKLFNRERIRDHAMRRWSAVRMADDYLQLYRAACVERFVAEGDESDTAAEA
jgi:glycosyltransferase involved in cell wall biosynthesis